MALATEVRQLTPLDGGGFGAVTSRGELFARHVAVATGSYHAPCVRLDPGADQGLHGRD